MPEDSKNIEERIKMLLIKYYLKELPADEELELDEYCSQRPGLQLIKQRLDNEELVDEDLSYRDKADAEESLSLIKTRIQQDSTPVKRDVGKLTWIISIAGAAAILFLIIKNTLTTTPAPAEKKGLAVNTIQRKISPGVNRATLTLFDGQKIKLDSAAEGETWNKHSITVTKTDTGHILYVDTMVQHAQEASEAKGTQYDTLETPRRGQFGITLPDGTRVWLNNASALYFPTVFTGGKREVQLVGEAYFEVAADVQRPFLVRLLKQQMTIRVLGTSFNVSAYSDDPAVRTLLVSGSVRVTKKDRSTLLLPQEQLIARPDGTWKRKKNIKEVPWRENKFDFTGAMLPQVISQIARQYDQDFEIRGPIRRHIFNGLVFRSVSLTSLLATLSEKGENFHYTFEGNKIIIRQ